MLKRLYSMTMQSLVLSMRNSLIWVLFGTLIIMILVVQFAMPKESAITQTQYVMDETDGKLYESMLRRSGLDGKYFLTDREELREKVGKEISSVGLVFEGAANNPEITLIHQGSMSEQNLNVVSTSLKKLVTAVREGLSGANTEKNAGTDTEAASESNLLEVRFLREQISPVPKNLAFVSVLMVFEVLILGFLMIAVFIFQEKQDGSIRAFRVTPGNAFIYISSRTLAFFLIGLLYGLILVLFTIGIKVNFLSLLLVTVFGFVLYTLIGMIIAAFFNDISEWFFIGIAALFVNMAPAFSHEFPSFSPGWISWFPSYQVLFCYDEIFFPSGKSLLAPIMILAVEMIAAYVLCHIIVKRKLMKEGAK